MTKTKNDQTKTNTQPGKQGMNGVYEQLKFVQSDLSYLSKTTSHQYANIEGKLGKLEERTTTLVEASSGFNKKLEDIQFGLGNKIDQVAKEISDIQSKVTVQVYESQLDLSSKISHNLKWLIGAIAVPMFVVAASIIAAIWKLAPILMKGFKVGSN